MIGRIIAPTHGPGKGDIQGIVESDTFQDKTLEREHLLILQFQAGPTWARLFANDFDKLQGVLVVVGWKTVECTSAST